MPKVRSLGSVGALKSNFGIGHQMLASLQENYGHGAHLIVFAS